LLVYNESHRTSLDRLRQIRQETQEKLDQQRVRQAATEEVGERLKRLQSELSGDLKALRPAP
jgi:DNA anti-recombination protein RmuC